MWVFILAPLVMLVSITPSLAAPAMAQRPSLSGQQQQIDENAADISATQNDVSTNTSDLQLTIDTICNLANAVNQCVDIALCTGTGKCSTTVFTTSTTQNGDLGGLSGADALCQDLADSAGLSGTYLAWLADANPGNAPNIRFNQATAPYKLTDFTELAADWTHLTCWPSYRTD